MSGFEFTPAQWPYGYRPSDPEWMAAWAGVLRNSSGASVIGDLVSYSTADGTGVVDSGITVGSVVSSVALTPVVTAVLPVIVGAVATISALRASTSTSLPRLQSYVLGFAANGDGGEGSFAVNSGDTTSADNGGTIIVDASARRWYRLTAGQPFSVRWFGATGNGTTDDTAAIQSAMTVAGVGGAIYLPAGTYKLTAVLSAPQSLLIRGAGESSTKLVQSSTTAGCMAFANAPSVYFIGGGVFDLTMSGGTVAQTVGSSGVGLLIEGANGGFAVNNVYIQGFGTGISIKGCWNNSFSNITILYNTFYGIAIGTDASYPTTGGNTFTTVNCENTGSISGGTPYGLFIGQTGGDYFTNVQVESYQIGIALSPAAGQQNSYCFFDSCLSDTNTALGWFINGTSAAVVSAVCTNCWACFNGSNGIEVQGASVASFRWVAGRIRENGSDGVYISGAFYTSILDSEIVANGRGTTAGAHAGVSVAANTNYFQVMNCQIGNFGSAFMLQGSSVSVANGTSTQFMITGNLSVSSEGGATPFFNGSTASASTYIVTNNLVS